MRIQDRKRSDYYDGVQGMDTDNKDVWVREPKTFNAEDLFTGLSDAKTKVREISPGSSYKFIGSYYLHKPVKIGFCGTVYNAILVTRPEDTIIGVKCVKPFKECFYDTDSYVDFLIKNKIIDDDYNVIRGSRHRYDNRTLSSRKKRFSIAPHTKKTHYSTN